MSHPGWDTVRFYYWFRLILDITSTINTGIHNFMSVNRPVVKFNTDALNHLICFVFDVIEFGKKKTKSEFIHILGSSDWPFA